MSSKNVDIEPKSVYLGDMSIMVNIKLDPRMKEAIQRLADKQFTSMSAIIKQAIEKHLKDNGIDWRKETPKK
jgi:predicted transcriptional regulator